jgi:hypothetical protein
MGWRKQWYSLGFERGKTMKPLFAVLLALTATLCLAADPTTLVIPTITKPLVEPREGDPLQEYYDKMWAEYEQAIAKAKDGVTAALDKQIAKATDSGELEHVKGWERMRKQFADQGTLDLAFSPKAAVDVTNPQKLPYPREMTEAVRKAIPLVARAKEELEGGYTYLVRAYTKDKNTTRANALTSEFAGLGKPPTTPKGHPQKTINLLANVPDGESGTWKMEDGALIGGVDTSAEEFSKLLFPEMALTDYELTVEFQVTHRRQGRIADVFIYLPVARQPFLVRTTVDNNTHIGSNADPTPATAKVISGPVFFGGPQSLVIRVSNNGRTVEAELNGTKLFRGQPSPRANGPTTFGFNLLPGTQALFNKIEVATPQPLANSARTDTTTATDKATVVSEWKHLVDGKDFGVLTFFSNGRLNDPDGLATWTLNGNQLVLRQPKAHAPGEFYVDTCTMSADGNSYAGRSKGGSRINGTRVK